MGKLRSHTLTTDHTNFGTRFWGSVGLFLQSRIKQSSSVCHTNLYIHVCMYCTSMYMYILLHTYDHSIGTSYVCNMYEYMHGVLSRPGARSTASGFRLS